MVFCQPCPPSLIFFLLLDESISDAVVLFLTWFVESFFHCQHLHLFACVCLYTPMPVHHGPHEEAEDILWELVLSMHSLGIELGSSDLVANVLFSEPSHWPHINMLTFIRKLLKSTTGIFPMLIYLKLCSWGVVVFWRSYTVFFRFLAFLGCHLHGCWCE